MILAPREPYVCIGYHQDLAQEVDLEYCQQLGLPVFRREVGGGAVYLDGKQIFFQLVLRRDNSLASGDKAEFYQRMLQPVADTYCDLGVPARYRPINDVVTLEGRKISGTGAATIGDYVVLVGNLIADFDSATMVRVLRVPDEKYRDRVFKSLQENLTTLRRETGREHTWDEMVAPLIGRFARVLGDLDPAELPERVPQEARALAPQFLSQEWLMGQTRRRSGRDVRIASGVNVVQRVHKAPGGLLRATLEMHGEDLTYVSLSGDFFCYPADAVLSLESALQGVRKSQVSSVLDRFYASQAFEMPGVSANDWLQVLTP